MIELHAGDESDLSSSEKLEGTTVVNSGTTTPAYWDDVLETKKERLRLNAWRKYMKSVYSRLIETWFPEEGGGPALKTDLFEEACTEHSLLSELGPVCIGFDHSFKIASTARENATSRDQAGHMLVCDLRSLPFRSRCIHQILSPSSLDHFQTRQDIDKAFGELGRVLMPGGVLILALDNPHNPAVWLRNHLPFAWLNRIGLVPYYVGPTCTTKEATSKLTAAGFEVTNCTAVAHVPRAPAIWLVMMDEKFGTGLGERLSRHFEAWEFLERWPLRYRTGYYIALRAVKCRN